MSKRISAATGNQLRCLGWRQEGILRMLENTLDNGERQEDLIIYGSTGQAARNWESYHAIVRLLKARKEDAPLKSYHLATATILCCLVCQPANSQWEECEFGQTATFRMDHAPDPHHSRDGEFLHPEMLSFPE